MTVESYETRLRYKVWPALAGGKLRDDSKILLRTGVSKDAPDFGENDVEDFFGSIPELVMLAVRRARYRGRRVFVKSFPQLPANYLFGDPVDNGEQWTVDLAGKYPVVIAGWVEE